MSNSGVYPLVSTSLVGQFRLTFGDVVSVALAPPVSGFQDYTNYSDAEIEAFLDLSDDSVNGAIGYAYLQAAGSASRESKTVKDYDLSVDLTKRAEDLRKTARFYFALADQAALLAGDDEAFDIVDTGNDRDLFLTDEGAPREFPYVNPWPWGNG